MNFVRLAVAASLASSSAVAAASPIAAWSTSDTATYAHLVNFDNASLATGTTVTTQFQAQGLTVGGTLWANGCGLNAWQSYGMYQNTLNTYGPGCYTNSSSETFSLKFASAVSAVAMDAYLYDYPHADVISLYRQNVLLASFTPMTITNSLANGYTQTGTRDFYRSSNEIAGILTLNGNGTLFDEIRFAENQASSGTYFVLDNVRFNATSVPEPASLSLFGLGLAGLAALRRKRAPKA